MSAEILRIGKKTWRLVVTHPGAIDGVTLAFARTRTMIESVAVDGRVLVPERSRVVWSPGEIGGTWSPPIVLPSVGPIEVLVRFLGEPPRLIRSAFVSSSDAGGPRHFAVPTTVLERLEDENVDRELLNLDLNRHAVFWTPFQPTDLEVFRALDAIRPEDVLRFRKRSIAERELAAAFFFDLDKDTDPRFACEEVRAAVDDLGYALDARLEARRFVGKDAVPQFDRLENPLPQRLEVISKLMVSLVDIHLNAIDLFDWAFELFATDRLANVDRDPGIHASLLSCGAPDGTLFFQFAELGLCAIDHDVHPQFWMERLPTFVRAAHVFAEHGSAMTAAEFPLSPGDYSFTEGRFYPRCRLQELREEYAGDHRQAASLREYLEDRLTSIVATALHCPGGKAPCVRTRPLLHRAELRKGGLSDLSRYL